MNCCGVRKIALIVALVAGVLGAPDLDASPSSEAPIRVGAHHFSYTDSYSPGSGRPLLVYTYRPAAHGPEDPILFVLHGNRRNAAAYRNSWIPMAEAHRLLIIAPLLDEDGYGWEAFRLGGMVRRDGPEWKDWVPVRRLDWTFALMDRLFGHVSNAVDSTQTGYDFFGHSAGGQFAHRFAIFFPESKAQRIVAANAGWYTFLSIRERFPYGLAGPGQSPPIGPVDLAAVFGKRLTLLLGTADIARDEGLRITRRADEQGRTRLSRGRAFFAAALSEARKNGAAFEWQKVEAAGVGHSSVDILPHAARLLYGPITEASSLR